MTTARVSVRRVVPNLRGDPAESRVFFKEVLDLEPSMEVGWIATFVSSVNPTAQISVIRENATASVHADVSVEVDDVDAVHAKAIAHGAEIILPLTDEPWGVRRFFVREPNGHVINVMMHLDS